MQITISETKIWLELQKKSMSKTWWSHLHFKKRPSRRGGHTLVTSESIWSIHGLQSLLLQLYTRKISFGGKIVKRNKYYTVILGMFFLLFVFNFFRRRWLLILLDLFRLLIRNLFGFGFLSFFFRFWPEKTKLDNNIIILELKKSLS